MPSLSLIDDPRILALDAATFEDLGCHEHGIVVLQGAQSWEARSRGFIELPLNDGVRRVAIGHDERKAPYALDEQGNEQDNFLFSLTDEEEYIACAWAVPKEGSSLLGVGIDLNATSHFLPRKSGRDYTRLLFTDHEKELIDLLEPDDPMMAKAALFAAKEAGFKSTAHPLRVWYRSHSEELLFEVRHFCMTEMGIERGEARDRAAQRAMDLMGIRQIAIRYAAIDDMALVTAVALSKTLR